VNKTHAAFAMNVDRMFATFPKVYFWTFTFKECWPDWYYPNAWHQFVRSLADVHGGILCGLRVLEVHEGGHGLHYHALLNLRVSVHVVRKLGAKVGMGRVHVAQCKTAKDGMYLAKYLSKKNPLHPGMRRWATVGGFAGVRKNDLECDSPFQRNIRKLTSGQQVTADFVAAVYHRSRVFGELEDWSKDTLDKLPRIRYKINADANDSRLN